MKMITLSLVAALAVNTAFANEAQIGTSALETSANMAVTSNYVWRGMSQTSNSPAYQAGVDIAYNGFYLGTWGSNISWTADNSSSLEADIYAGYTGKVSGISYDLGYIVYSYPNVSNVNNFKEAYLGLGKDFEGFSLNAKYSFGIDNAPDDYEITYATNVSGFGFSASYGDYDTVGTRYSLAVSKEIGKFELSVGYYDFTSDNNSASDEDHVVVSLSTSF